MMLRSTLTTVQVTNKPNSIGIPQKSSSNCLRLPQNNLNLYSFKCFRLITTKFLHIEKFSKYGPVFSLINTNAVEIVQSPGGLLFTMLLNKNFKWKITYVLFQHLILRYESLILEIKCFFLLRHDIRSRRLR